MYWTLSISTMDIPSTVQSTKYTMESSAQRHIIVDKSWGTAKAHKL